MPDQTAQPPTPEPPRPAWLLAPDALAAIHADRRLLDRLAAGELPAVDDLDPVAAALAAWLVEVEVEDGSAL